MNTPLTGFLHQQPRSIGSSNRYRNARIAVASVAFALLSTVVFGQEALSGFYAIDQNACLQATGTLYVCEAGQCAGRDYQRGQPLSPQTSLDVRQAAGDAVDANGYDIKAGDYFLRFSRDGGTTLRVLRQTGAKLLTTYLARLNGSKSFAFIKDGIRVDPSAPAAGLERCPAYDGFVTEQRVTLQTPNVLQARAQAPDLNFKLDYGHVGPEVMSVEFEVPKAGAHIVDVVPVTLQDPDYPALFVLWVLDIGGTLLPLQILTYDHDRQLYADGTMGVIDGPVPQVDYPMNVAIAQFGKNGTGFFIGNSGYDGLPFKRTTNTLLLPAKDGRLRDRSDLLPKVEQFTHDVSSGVIDKRGRWGIYVNDMYIPEFYASQVDGTLADAARSLPSSIHRDGPKFTSSAMADVNGDGLSDLVLGSADQRKWPSRIFLNDGKGRFNRSAPIELPKSPLEDRTGPITGEVVGAGIMDIQPMYLTSDQYADLVVVSVGGFYKGNAIQILVNDGEGNFADRTSDLIDGPQEVYLNRSDTPYSWVRNVTVLDNDGTPDIITQSDSPTIVPSYVLASDVDGKFHVAAYVKHVSIASGTLIGGKPTLIEIGRDTIRLVEYPAADGSM